MSLSWASSIQSIPSHPTFWRSILILSSHLRLDLPSGLFPSGFPTKTLYTTLLSPIRAKCPAHLIIWGSSSNSNNNNNNSNTAWVLGGQPKFQNEVGKTTLPSVISTVGVSFSVNTNLLYLGIRIRLNGLTLLRGHQEVKKYCQYLGGYSSYNYIYIYSIYKTLNFMNFILLISQYFLTSRWPGSKVIYIYI